MRRLEALAALAASRPGLAAALKERLAAKGLAVAGLGIHPGDADLGIDAQSRSTNMSVAIPPGVIVERDVAYGTDPAQRLDVYRRADASAAPIFLFVHGGGWRRGDKAMPQMVRNKMTHWLGRGAVFASANYRLLPQADLFEQADDIARALAYVQQAARRWGGDPARVVLVGHSAGAHLAALLAADASIADCQGAVPWLATIAMDSAALDVVAIMNRPHFGFYDPVFGVDPAYWRQVSPMHRLQSRPVTPVLLVCSSLRADAGPPAHAFAAKANALDGAVTVLPVALTHLQVNDQLGVAGPYTEAVDAFMSALGLP